MTRRRGSRAAALGSLVGFAFTLFGLGILAYVLAMYLVHGATVPGFAFIASIIAIFSGAQLFAFGIIGEYLARMHFRSMERPPYLVCESAGPASAGACTPETPANRITPMHDAVSTAGELHA